MINKGDRVFQGNSYGYIIRLSKAVRKGQDYFRQRRAVLARDEAMKTCCLPLAL